MRSRSRAPRSGCCSSSAWRRVLHGPRRPGRLPRAGPVVRRPVPRRAADAVVLYLTGRAQRSRALRAFLHLARGSSSHRGSRSRAGSSTATHARLSGRSRSRSTSVGTLTLGGGERLSGLAGALRRALRAVRDHRARRVDRRDRRRGRRRSAGLHVRARRHDRVRGRGGTLVGVLRLPSRSAPSGRCASPSLAAAGRWRVTSSRSSTTRWCSGSSSSRSPRRRRSRIPTSRSPARGAQRWGSASRSASLSVVLARYRIVHVIAWERTAPSSRPRRGDRVPRAGRDVAPRARRRHRRRMLSVESARLRVVRRQIRSGGPRISTRDHKPGS